MSMDFQELLDRADELAEEALSRVDPVRSGSVGLDPRAAHDLWVTKEFVAVSLSQRGGLDYYGGFEYIDPEHVVVVGSYAFYSAASPRVAEVIERKFYTEE